MGWLDVIFWLCVALYLWYAWRAWQAQRQRAKDEDEVSKKWETL